MGIYQPLVQKAYAAAVVPNPGTGFTLSDFFMNVMTKFVLPVIAAICIGAIIWAGFLFVSSQGDAEKIKTARASLMWAVVGIVVIALSYVLVVAFTQVVTTKIF